MAFSTSKCIAIVITTVLCLATLFIVVCHTADQNPTLTISTGRIKGSVHRSTDGRPFDAYLGIPYAKPPTDQLRFKPPEPVEPWTGILDTTEDRAACPQVTVMKTGADDLIAGDEDCLFVNVYRPQTDRKQLTVLVFVHGGAFYVGTGRMSDIRPHKFMDEDIVLVTLNYRLGVLGFLSSDDENAYGNYGMLDQVLALRWVQQNIRNFGGDPDKVTVFGVSAGGGSVALLVVSPLSRGLFRAAIAQSGSSLGYWIVQKKPLMWAKKIAQEVLCPTSNNREMVDCLRTVPANDLMHAENSFRFAPLFPLIMLPVVEAPGGSGFLPEDPLVLLKEGRIGSKVPYITGITKDEGFAFAHLMRPTFETKGQEFFDEEFPARFLTHIVHVKSPEEVRLKSISKAIQKEYFRTGEDLNDPSAFLERYSDFLGDAMFNVGADLTLNLMSNTGIDVYAYKYTYSADHSLARIFFGLTKDGRVNHGEDMGAQFYPDPATTTIDGKESISTDATMSKIMNRVWVNFATTLKPSFDGTPVQGQSLEWKPFDPAKPNYLELTLNPSMKEEVINNRTRFWMETVRSLAYDDLHEKEEL